MTKDSKILIPMEGKFLYEKERTSVTILKVFLTSAIVILITLAAIRYEQRISVLEARISIMEIETIRTEYKDEMIAEKPRSKREALADPNGIPPWVKRTGEGDPHLNSEYRDFLRTSSQSTSTGSRRSQSTVRSQEPQLIRNDEEETFFTKNQDGSYVSPSGLREIYERLPPVSEEVGYQSPPINYDLQTRASSGAGPRVAIPPVQDIGRGRDQVSARVIRFDDDKETTNTVAGHFVADVSNFTSNDNPRLRNSNGIFQIWRPADWMSGDHFNLDKSDGVVTVKTAGIYHIYAQIHYHDVQLNSFVVEINDIPLLQCTTTQESNSCYTGGLKSLESNDRIVIKNVGVDRFSIYKPEKSFFGLMKIGN